MDLARFSGTLAELGRIFREVCSQDETGESGTVQMDAQRALNTMLNSEHFTNTWFIPRFTRYAANSWGEALQPGKINQWLDRYHVDYLRRPEPKRIGIVMAGNLPMVGLHDLICVLASGNTAVIRLSSRDDRLIPAVAEVMFHIQPSLKDRVVFTNEVLKGFEAIIATGSNNTSRYFEYYFSKFPSVIRRNRNGVAVIEGTEPPEWFRRLGDDLFLYFGLGCRSVSKLYLSEGVSPEIILPYLNDYDFLIQHHKYCNNYDYQKSLLLINRAGFHENGVVLLRQDASIPSPVAVIHYEHFNSNSGLLKDLQAHSDEIQCVVAHGGLIPGSVKAGETQRPELWDYADGIDTMEFLLDL